MTVIIPTKQCADTIAGVVGTTVAPLRDAGLVDDVVVVDAASRDRTDLIAAQAGARVLQEDDLLPEYGTALGKGDAMWRALHATSGEVVCFLDGDTPTPTRATCGGLSGHCSPTRRWRSSRELSTGRCESGTPSLRTKAAASPS